MQRITPGICNTFVPVEKALHKIFFLALFEGLGDVAPERGVTRLPVKQAGLTLPCSTLTALDNWKSSCVITGHLVAALREQVEFRTADHSACLREGRMAVWRRITKGAEEALAATIAGALVQGTRQLQRETKTGAWLTMQPSTVNRTEIGAK